MISSESERPTSRCCVTPSRARNAGRDAGLGEFGAGQLQSESVGNLALGFMELATKIEGLQANLKEVLAQEGRQLASGVMEYVLACFHSHDPTISLEPVQLGIVEEKEEAARSAVREVAEQIAQYFSREDEAAEAAEDADDGGAEEDADETASSPPAE